MQRFVDPQASANGGAAASNNPADFRLGGNSTVVMSDYHICKYDALLGVLVCIGDDSDVLVLGKDMCRELIPLKKGSHWLDCYLYMGTTTFLVLSPDQLLCLDYSVQKDDASLSCGAPGQQFTSLHVPQGLTVGAVGRRSGVVSYFRFVPVSQDPEVRPKLVWTTVDLNVLDMCRPFCPGAAVEPDTSKGRFLSTGSVLSMDSYPDNPNAFIGVVAGVPGVCKWYIDESRLSCFFDARGGLPANDDALATCKVTPGGNYVVALTVHSTTFLIWNESKKKRDKSCAVYWSFDVTGGGVPPNLKTMDPFWFNEYRVGIHMARTALEDSLRATNDKHSQMYLLLHGQNDIVEVVIRIDDKEVLRKEQIIAHLNAFTARMGVEAAKKARPAEGENSMVANYFSIFHVEPCVLSNYWQSGLTDVDLEALFVTSSDGLRPILAKRNRTTGGIESIKELRELNRNTAWYPRAIMVRLPEEQLKALAEQRRLMPPTTTWETLLHGGDTLLPHSLLTDEQAKSAPNGALSAALWPQMVMVTVTDAAQAVCLSPQSNEAFAVHTKALQNCVPWSSLSMGQDPASLLLEQEFPSLSTCFLPTELIVRVFVTESLLLVMKNDVRRNTGSMVLSLDRAALHLEGSGTPDRRMVQKGSIVDARLEPSPVTGNMSAFKDGKSLLLLLEDSSVMLVDLSGAKDEEGKPHTLYIPTGLLPVGAVPVSVDAFWMPTPGLPDGSLCLACLFADRKGFLVWNLSRMRMVAYSQPAYAATATQLYVTNSALPPQPNMSGEVRTFDVTLRLTESPDTGAEYGVVLFRDALGHCLFHLALAFGLAPGAPQRWCFQLVRIGGADDAEWTAVELSAAARFFLLKFAVVGSMLEWSWVSADASFAGKPLPLPGSVTSVKSTWSLGSAELTYDTAHGEMRSYLLNAKDASPTAAESAASRVAPTVAFVSQEQIAVVDVTSLFEGGGGGGTGSLAPKAEPAIGRLDSSRTMEHFSLYRGRGALIIVTRDANGWRWLNIVDGRTAQPRMAPYATLDFVGEEKLKILLVEIDNILHLYFMGTDSGVVGHFFIEANLGAGGESSIKYRRCFAGRRYHHMPSTFRGYRQFLPPQPTLKQETGFFKRLMTLPWEDIALKLESETLKGVKAAGDAAVTAGSAATTTAPPPPVATTPAEPDRKKERERNELLQKTPAAPATAAAPPVQPQQPQAAATQAAAPAGSRYEQLKAIAKQENVSLAEARRMMSENIRKLQNRGEKLDEIQNKSAELADRAMTFQDLARQLKEKQRNSWF